MKKVLLFVCLLVLLTGCTNINKSDYGEIVGNIATKASSSNVYRTGYSYYLPRGMKVYSSKLYNEVIEDENYRYYLYVDMVSYYKKINSEYNIISTAIYSQKINFDNKFGYVEINLLKNDKYLVEIMYNYAKIEVIVNSNDIASAITNSLIILTSVNYNDDIIDNLLEEDVLNYSEETFNIFETNSNDSNFLKVVEEYDNYNEDEVPDYDLIKEN